MTSIAEITLTYLINALWMTCVIAAATVLLSQTLRRCAASYRHGLWVAALLLAVLLPLSTLRSPLHNYPTRRYREADNIVQSGTVPSGGSSWLHWPRMRRQGQAIQFVPLAVGLLTVFYVGFISYRAVRLYRGWRSLQTVLRQSSEARSSPSMNAVVERCHSLLGLAPVPILSSPQGRGPATVGVRKPVLILPEWFLLQASEDELASTLGHELAHVRRGDFVLNLAYEILILPICFHPAATLIKNRVDQTRELACDEIATECLPSGTQYARSLLRIAESMAANQRRAGVAYALGLFDANTLEARIMNVIAKSNRLRKTRARMSALGASGLLVAVCLAVSGFSVEVTQAQNRDVDLQPFVGTWEAKFKGKVFGTIKLQRKQHTLTGTVSHFDVNVDPKSGELSGVEVLDGSDAIVDAKLKGEILRITEQDDLQFEIKITGTDQAELQVVMPPDGPIVKPWKMERVANP